MTHGILAQLGEHLPYKQRVTGSSPVGPIELFNCEKFLYMSRQFRLGSLDGGIAQLARALGSYPGCRWFKSDCRYHFYGPLVKRLRHRPFTAESWVRFPYGSPQNLAERSARFLFYVFRQNRYLSISFC